MLFGECEQWLRVAVDKKQPGINAEGFTIFDQCLIIFLAALEQMRLDLQRERPGNGALHFLFIDTDLAGAKNARIVAKSHTKMIQKLCVCVTDHFAEQLIVGAVFVLKHVLYGGKEVLLKLPV